MLVSVVYCIQPVWGGWWCNCIVI